MPYTVLKISKTVEAQREITGEFPEEAEAHKSMEDSQLADSSDNYEYMVESPPSKID